MAYVTRGHRRVRATAGIAAAVVVFAWMAPLPGLAAGDPPVFQPAPPDQTHSALASVSLQITAVDPDGGTVTYSATGLPQGLTINSTSGVISGTINHGAYINNPHIVKVTAKDSDNDTAQAQFEWTVIHVNLPPVAGDRTIPVPEDGPGIVVNLLDGVTDPDVGDTLAATVIDAAGVLRGTLTDHGDGTATYVPDPNFDGTDSFIFKVTDAPAGTSDTAQIQLEITAVDDAPTLDPIVSQVVDEETEATFVATASDPDTGDIIGFSLNAGADPVPAGATIDPVTGAFNWTPSEAQGPGEYDFVARATDLAGLYDEQPISIEVTETNQPPVLGPPADRTDAEGDSVDFSISASDPDLPANHPTYSATGLPPGVDLDPETGRVTGNLPYSASAQSPYQVEVTVADDVQPLVFDTVEFDWTVTNTNRAPRFDSVPATIAATVGDVVNKKLVAHDPDGDDITWDAQGLPTDLSIEVATGKITGTVREAGISPVTVVATDEHGSYRSAVVTVKIEPGPTTPVTTVPPTTTTTTTTTTLPPPPTTTTVLPPPPTTTTIPPTPPATTTTTTTMATTTTTLPPAADPPPPPPPVESSEVTVTEAEMKDQLVVMFTSRPSTSSPEEGSSGTTTGRRLSPTEGMTVAFTTAVETLQSQLLPSLGMGGATAFLLLLGIDRRRKDEDGPENDLRE